MSKIRAIIFLLTFLMLFGLVGLAQKTDLPKPTERDKPQLKQFEEKRYRLNPGDVISVSYRYTPEYNQTVTIQPDGYITLEIVGEVKIGGLTVEEARKEILTNASKRLKDPEMILLLKEFKKPYFVVSGEVVQPGKFEMNEDITALQAVLLAGGFKDSAKTSQILVYRKINSDTAEVKLLNLKSVKKTSDLENDFELQSGDMILVPRNLITKVERFVKFTSFANLFAPFLF
jgi:polysaccharide export outer membrane protein